MSDKAKAKELLELADHELWKLSEEDRHELLIGLDYCRYCSADTSKTDCYCTRDD